MKEKNEYFEWDDIQTKLAAIHGIDNIKKHLNPTARELHNPYLLKNLKEARDRIVQAIKLNQKISIHIDVDADGATSGSLMFNYLREFTSNVCYFHAQRSEGHGVEISEEDVPKDTQLLIIIDSSTNSVDACERIKQRGIDIVVLDHHEQDILNPHCILVNPQQEGCEYPNKQISGAVVAWKMCQAIDDHYHTSYADDYCDLAAIGLIGDVMSLAENENRYIVKKGLSNIYNRGIKALLVESKRDLKKISVDDVGYLIAPIINAACRMDRIEVILELLTEDDFVRASEISKEVIKMNEERKKIQSYFQEKLVDKINENDNCSIIIDDEIGSGFKGLVAGNFCDKFKKTIIIVSPDSDGTYFGSYRYYGNEDFKKILNDIPEIIYAAGHKTVGGTRFKIEDLEVVRDKINKITNKGSIEEKNEYVMELTVEELNFKTIDQIEKFYEISGKGFEKGIFLIKNLVPHKVEVIGKHKNTIKIPCVSEEDSLFLDTFQFEKLNTRLTIMKFNTSSEIYDKSMIGKTIEAYGTLNINEWYNPKLKKKIVNYQLFLDDYNIV